MVAYNKREGAEYPGMTKQFESKNLSKKHIVYLRDL